MAPNVPDDPHWLRSNKAKLGILLAVIAIIGGIVTGISQEWFRWKLNSGSASESPPPSSSPTPVTSSPSSSPSVGDTPGPVSALDVQYLSELKPVSKPFGVNTGGAEIDKQPYAHSVWVAVGACSKSDHSLTYQIDSDWKTFTASVGLSEKSEKRYKIFFQVYVDEKPIEPGYTVEANTWPAAHKIEVPISSAHQVKLAATWLKGGECNDGNVSLATWGDAMFSR